MLIQRSQLRCLLELLVDKALVLVEGPPRSGKTCFAAQIQRAALGGALLLDGAARGSRQSLLEPELSFSDYKKTSLVVVDRADAEIAATLAAFVLSGATKLRFVLIGTRFPTDEALLGPACGAILGEVREGGKSPIPRLGLGPLSLFEVGRDSGQRLWLRGGYPEAFLAQSDEAAFGWLEDYAQSVAEARFGAAGLPWAPGRTGNLLSMLAEAQASPLNENAIARSLGVSRPTVLRSVAALENLGIVRSLEGLACPAGGRSVKGSAIYLRDSGLHHALLGLKSREALLGSSRLAASWEGYAMEEALSALPPAFEARRYRSRDGAGFELVLLKGGVIKACAAFRWARPGKAAPRGLRYATERLRPGLAFLVLPEGAEADLGQGLTQIGLPGFLERLAALE